MAPATLVFHGVTDQRISDWGDSGFRTALHLISIDRIDRAPVPDQKVFLDRPYYSWRIRLNCPQGGEIGRTNGRRFVMPDGTERYLVDEAMLLERTRRLGGRLLDPLKTTIVQDQRSMTTRVVRKIS